MIKILSALKGHGKEVLIIALLILGQVYCDLSLPTYTSNLVDVGIQQGGIEDAVPEQISEKSLGELALLMSDEEEDLVDKSYVKEAGVYKLEADKRDELRSAFEKPMLIAYMLEQSGKFSMGDLKAMYDAGQITKEEIKAQMEANSQGMDGFEDSLVTQAAVQYLKGEYESLGLDLDEIQKDYLWHTAFIMLIFTVIMLALAIVSGYVASKVGASVGRDLRKKVFTRVLAFGHLEMDKFSTASLITRSTNDIQQVQIVIVLMLRVVMMAPIMGVAACLKVVGGHTGLGWIIVCALAAILILMATLFIIAMPKFKIMQKLVDKLNLVSREIITGIPVIRAFSRERHEEGRFDEASLDLMKTQLFTNRAMASMMPIMMLIMNGLSLAIVWFGSKGVDLGTMQVGDMMAFITYTIMIVMSFMMLTVAAILIPRAGVAAERIDEVLKTDNSIKNKEDAIELDKCDGLLEFKNVCFRYPNADEDVIHNISFTANPGETTAIIGSTGSGKSTVLNLIPRFYDVSGGEILLDGHDIRDLNLESLRDKIGYVPQKATLFSGDIRSNIKFASNEISDEKMKEAARIAQAEEFIMEKDEKYSRTIAQGGSNISGGQKQRLSIARAIAKDPSLYLFDDSFSALDYKTDAILRRELAKAVGHATCIIVAQRIATIFHADKIIVMDEGQIVGMGTHAELMETCETYKEIASSQLSEADMDNMRGGAFNE
ncbi:MAG: ABC transporter ATP-binding protein/permease [Clostridia bacterium]|nr:ABC transporter ATP-binding protein/permease [Clostridia bacterium]